VVGLIVIGHMPFASALQQCAKHVYGCVPERCVVIDVMADADVEAELARARQAVLDVDSGDGVMVFVDMFGATPGNIATQLAQPGRVEVIAGVNLPMLMRTLCYRDRTKIADLPEKALGGGASGMMKIASTAPHNQRPLYPSPFPHDPNSNDGGPTDGSSRLQDQ
jgi:PTS system ascorbate-specific IIA component